MDAWKAMPAHSRIWIYQSDQPLEGALYNEVQRALDQFVSNWTAHAKSLTAQAFIYQNRFLIFMVDEQNAAASGCSIDKSVHFLKQLEQHYQLSVFDRMQFAYQNNDQLKVIHASELKQSYEKGVITDETLFCDTLVKNKGEFETEWLKPLAQSWHANMI